MRFAFHQWPVRLAGICLIVTLAGCACRPGYVGPYGGCIPRAAGPGRRNDHAKYLFPRAGRVLRGHDRRVLDDHVDAQASGGMVGSSGLASRMALWLARLLLGSARCRRCCSVCRCRFTSGRLCTAAHWSRSGLDPAALEWPLPDPRTLGMTHDVSHTRPRWPHRVSAPARRLERGSLTRRLLPAALIAKARSFVS